MQLDQTSMDAEVSADLPSEPAIRKGMDAEAARYMQGDVEPATSSVLISNSKYLNNPYYRDVYAQYALRRHSHDLPTTYLMPALGKALGEVTDYADFSQRLKAEKKANQEFGAWLAARRYTTYRREDLAGCASGTLGHAIWEFLGISGVEMELQMKGVEVTNDIDYISMRRGANHDIEHIVTGFGPNSAGELALALTNITTGASYFAPELAQHINAGISFLSSAALQRNSLHYPAALPVMLDAIRLGIEMGQALKRPLLLEQWEDMLDWQIDDIASHLGIVRGPDAGWNWTTSATTG
jgi:ubiquinone biosynthesis protein COQ4